MNPEMCMKLCDDAEAFMNHFYLRDYSLARGTRDYISWKVRYDRLAAADQESLREVRAIMESYHHLFNNPEQRNQCIEDEVEHARTAHRLQVELRNRPAEAA